MNYKRIYDKIIEKRRDNFPEGYSETHHILPRSLGGKDNEDNLVLLTAREHYLAHALLVKIYEEHSWEWYKMVYAFSMMQMTNQHQKRYTSHLYEYHRQKVSKAGKMKTGNFHNNYGRIWINDGTSNKMVDEESIPIGWIKGRLPHLNEESKKRISKANSKRIITDEYRVNLSKNNFSKKDPKKQKEHAKMAGSKKKGKGKRMWITNGCNNILHRKEDVIPEGYYKGRIT